MQKRLLISGIVFVLIMGAGYGIMQFTGNEEPSSAGMPAGIVVTADAAQKETMPQTTADQSVIATDTAGALTAAEVAQHTTESDCWIIVNNGVYNVTNYAPIHPGGKKEIVSLCGKDATSAFDGQHGGDRKPEMMLVKLKIGDLQK